MAEMDKRLILIKLHFFLFFATLGPVLPFLNVIGKQHQISEMVMGTINAILPLAVLVAKPCFGFLIDLLHKHRKLLFMILIGVMVVGFSMLAVIPARCHMECSGIKNQGSNNTFHNFTPTSGSIESLPYSTNTSYNLLSSSSADTLLPPTESNPSPYSPSHNISRSSVPADSIAIVSSVDSPFNSSLPTPTTLSGSSTSDCHLVCDSENLYKSLAFWSYALFMCIGILGFNIVSSTSDAVCFDMLGVGNEAQYGMQRLFGTFGYALSALSTGWAIDYFSGDAEIKSYAPAYFLVILFGVLDLICCSCIKLPRLPQSKSILKDISKVMKQPYIKPFLTFAGLAGFCEGFVIYNLFWYMEDLAIATGQFHSIKRLQGLTVVAGTMCGEVVIFYFSDRIIDTMGYGHCLTFCFFAYFIRLGAVALAPSPWWLLPIELLTQGPSYALSYTCVVAYASAIAPPGTSATMQGVAAGINDGFGYSVASFLGGFLYTKEGGKFTFAFFSATAFVSMIAHAAVYHRAAKILKRSSQKGEYQATATSELEPKFLHSVEANHEPRPRRLEIPSTNKPVNDMNNYYLKNAANNIETKTDVGTLTDSTVSAESVEVIPLNSPEDISR